MFSPHNYENYTIIILILLDEETETGYVTCPRTQLVSMLYQGSNSGTQIPLLP